jgi:hypothetical protein
MRRKEQDSRDYQAPEKVIEATQGGVEIEQPEIAVASGPKAEDYAAEMAFNEDMLTIVIHQSADPKPEDPVQVGVNGRNAYIWRGQKTMVPRKYVEVLLRAQTNAVQQDVTAREEVDFNRLTIRPTQRYPLSVLHDPSPRGQAWLQAITQGA